MNVKNRLRNNLVRKIQQLSTAKLTEITKLLSTLEHQLNAKETTLQLAGSWKELNDDVFNDLTEKLHENRANDRQIK